MLRPSLANGKEAHLASMGNFKQQEDLKMYIKLPDYDNFQGYGLGWGFLIQVDRGIYANFHNTSWGTLKRHLFMAKITKKLY